MKLSFLNSKNCLAIRRSKAERLAMLNLSNRTNAPRRNRSNQDDMNKGG